MTNPDYQDLLSRLIDRIEDEPEYLSFFNYLEKQLNEMKNEEDIPRHSDTDTYRSD
jgi:hypothetical protein